MAKQSFGSKKRASPRKCPFVSFVLGLKIFLADTCRIALEKTFKEREMNPQPMTPRNHKKCIELTHLTSKKLTILVVLYKDRADQKIDR